MASSKIKVSELDDTNTGNAVQPTVGNSTFPQISSTLHSDPKVKRKRTPLESVPSQTPSNIKDRGAVVGLGVAVAIISGRLYFPVMKTMIGISAAITPIRTTILVLLQSLPFFFSIIINLSIQYFF